MESIECKNCGSSEIIKGAGFYFCRSCGTRYSIEEVEGTQVERIALLQSNDNTIRKTAHLIPQEDVSLKIAFIDYLINVDDVPQDIFSSLKDVKVEKSYVPVYLLGVNWNANWNATFSHQESHQEQEYDYNGRVKGSRTVYETINRSANGSCGGFAAAAVSANGSQNRTIFRSQSQVFKGELKDSLPHIDDYPNESFEFRKPNDSEIMDTIYPSIWGEVRGNASNMGHYNESMSACDFHISSVSIDSIDLIYVPFWHLWYYYNNKKYEASINAGNGFVHTTPPTEDNTQLSQKRSELKEREGRMWMWWTIAGVLLGLVILSLCCSWRSTIYWVIATIASIALLLVQININKRLKAEIKRLQQEGIVERKNSAYAVFGEKLNNIGVTMRLNGEISNSSSHLAHEKSEERVAEHSECNNTAEPQPPVDRVEETAEKSHFSLFVAGGIIIGIIAAVLVFKDKDHATVMDETFVEEAASLAETSENNCNYLYDEPMSEIMGNYSGTISGTAEAKMKVVSDGSGTFGYDCNGSWVERIVKLSTFNQSTKHLVITEYDKSGSYIGEFDGIYSHGNYTGTFTNYKGASVPFDLLHRR